MQKILITILAITGMLFAISCGKDDDGGATVALSEKVFEFTTDGGAKSLIVTAKEEWLAVGAEWIHTKKDGNKLTVSVDVNRTIQDREGVVAVSAGNAVEFLTVKQKAAVADAVVTPNSIVVEDSVGEIVLEVNATDEDWFAKTDADWLTVTPKQHRAEMVIAYAKNEIEDDRVADVIVTVGKVEKIVQVRQLGKMFFLLPYSKIGVATVEEVKEFEAARMNKFEDSGYDDFLSFKTRSKDMFPDLFYKIEYGVVAKARIAAFSGKRMEKELPAFKEWLKGKGFVEKSEFLLINKEMGLSVKIDIAEDYSGSKYADILFDPVIIQDKDYPTFKEFPYLFAEWGAKKDKIDAYEAGKGGIYNEAQSEIGGVDPNTGEPYRDDFLFYDVPENKQGNEKEYSRSYLVYRDNQPKPGLYVSFQLMRNTEVAYFMYKGRPTLTKEFKELCEQEGFTYLGKSQGNFDKFYSIDKELVFKIRISKRKDDESPFLELHMLKFEY